MMIGSRARSLEAVILAGGQGRRLGGADKGLLEIGPGRTILEHLIIEIEETGIETIRIGSGRPDMRPFARVDVMPDLRPDHGPLGGIETALSSVKPGVRAVLVVPCDMPGLRSAHLEALLGTHELHPGTLVVAASRQEMQPLVAVVPVHLLPRIRAALDGGARKVREVWSGMGYHQVVLDDAQAFININTPEDRIHWSRP